MKLVIPASLKLKGLGITGEEKSWVDLCKSMGLDGKGQSAHRLIKTKHPDVHDAICKDCIYDKDPKTAVKPTPVKGAEKVKAGKAKKAAGTVTCYNCKVTIPKNLAAVLTLPGVVHGLQERYYCMNCTFGKLLA